jgi:hypothetical protein
MGTFRLVALVSNLLLAASPFRAADTEVGTVKWGRDLQAGLETSRTTGKPILLFFQEVPGCSGCQQFGREVMSHPLIVEAIEAEFVPVVVYNNRPGKDAALLDQFGEPAWNYQVLRFLDAAGQDLIPRRDKIWTVESVAARLVLALNAAKRPVPAHLTTIAIPELVPTPGTAAFAMPCFWTGELRLGAIDGVLTTEAGFFDGHEVTKLSFDREVVTLDRLIAAAASAGCAISVYTETPGDAEIARAQGIPTLPLDHSYRRAPESDQKKQISGTPFATLELNPVQATKVNAHARTDPKRALAWLSPGQVANLTHPQTP